MGGSRKQKTQRGSDVVTMSTGQALREREGWLGGWVGRGVGEGKKAVRWRRGEAGEKINPQVTRGAASSHKDRLQPRHFSITPSCPGTSGFQTNPVVPELFQHPLQSQAEAVAFGGVRYALFPSTLLDI